MTEFVDHVMGRVRGVFSRFPLSGTRWMRYVFALDSPWILRGFKLLVIALIVWMLVSAQLETCRNRLENELALVRPPAVSDNLPAQIRTGPSAASLKEYTGIAARNLFATSRVASENASRVQEEKLVIEEMPLASLKLKLLGTVVASEPGMSSAIIAEENGRNEQLYREGESVKGAQIKKILRNAVIVDTGKRDEVLKMDTGKQAVKKPPSKKTTRSSRVRPVQVVTHESLARGGQVP